MGTFEDFLNKIKFDQGLRFDQEVAQFMGIDKRSLAVAKARGSLPIKYINWYCEYYKIRRVEFETHITNKQNEETEEMSIHLYEDHIQLQKDKIANLEQENLRLKESLNDKTPESSHWDDLRFHYKTEVELHWTSFGVLGRTILSVSNIKEQSKVLGYSEKELTSFWDIGTKYEDMRKHSIDTILHQDSKDELRDVAKTLPTVFSAIKDMIGNHYIPTKLMYKCKDGSYIGAISYNKIDWRTQKVYSKIAFLIEA